MQCNNCKQDISQQVKELANDEVRKELTKLDQKILQLKEDVISKEDASHMVKIAYTLCGLKR